jgi:RNA polymerase primary sigma factor
MSQMMSKSKVEKPAATFRTKALEGDFVNFCQLNPKTDDNPTPLHKYETIRQQALAYIFSTDFTERGAEKNILGHQVLNLCEPTTPARTTRVLNLPPHLSGLCESQLLAPEQEQHLFRRFNYLRFRAAEILERLPGKTPSEQAAKLSQWDAERVQGLLAAADWHRDCIVQANLRLVISIVKKFANQQCSFDDLLSDGIMALIRSVDKFDYQLGFRFSTYATQVVRRNSYKFVMDRQDERLKITNSIHESGLDIAEQVVDSSLDEARWSELRSQLRGYLNRLDKREKLIVRARFSLGGHRRVQTLQRLADCLGISKERVRQLEKRALEKLAVMAQTAHEVDQNVAESAPEYVYN